MELNLKQNAFIGQESRVDLIDYVSWSKQASLSVRVRHMIAGPITDYVVYYRAEIWFETNVLSEAIEAWNKLITQQKLD